MSVDPPLLAVSRRATGVEERAMSIGDTNSATSANPSVLLATAVEHKRRAAWEPLAALGASLPSELDGSWIAVASEVAFAMGQLSRFTQAIALQERIFAVSPAWRTASALAYLHYAASLSDRVARRRGKGRDADARDQGSGLSRDALRKGFQHWIAQALEREPTSIKDLYRLGVWESQIESRHDAVALRAFEKAIATYRAMSDDDRARRHDLRKPFVRSLYGAGRSALRLRTPARARRHAFDCIREDREHDFVEPLHKYHLAGKVCLATRELEAAERALRLALDGAEKLDRDFVFGTLADVALARGDAASATQWIDAKVPAHRRSAALWRKLGDARSLQGDAEKALAAWQTSLLRDRHGRHLTFVRIGDAQLALGRAKDAERSFRQAIDFRRRQYQSDDLAALRGLAGALDRLGRGAEATSIRERLEGAEREHGPMRDGQRATVPRPLAKTSAPPAADGSPEVARPRTVGNDGDR